MTRGTLEVFEADIFRTVKCWLAENGRATDAAKAEKLVLTCVRLHDLTMDELLGNVRKSRLVSDGAILDAIEKRTERQKMSDEVVWWSV